MSSRVALRYFKDYTLHPDNITFIGGGTLYIYTETYSQLTRVLNSYRGCIPVHSVDFCRADLIEPISMEVYLNRALKSAPSTPIYELLLNLIKKSKSGYYLLSMSKP